ncbi:alpha/beta fold hydrolase [Paenacidovorax monticola]|uniref:alpha/beta fold hydrolase n=1 Tax=Paenacidovorax monticola TaxID=1926868 RepID=UPI001FEA5917|nr:alpha/beta fold hydrolase [Paenacidovorax monticola]
MPSTPPSPIVLFHDSLGCVELWRDLPAALCLATGRPVIAYDRLGFGRSDARRLRPPLDFVAQEADDYFPVLREQLGVERFIALGHSVGGGMAIHCAAEWADTCDALVTVAAQVFAEERTLGGIRVAREQFQDPQQIERLARYHGSKAPGCSMPGSAPGWTRASHHGRSRACCPASPARCWPCMASWMSTAPSATPS